jgi:hypothetical protein
LNQKANYFSHPVPFFPFSLEGQNNSAAAVLKISCPSACFPDALHFTFIKCITYEHTFIYISPKKKQIVCTAMHPPQPMVSLVSPVALLPTSPSTLI